MEPERPPKPIRSLREDDPELELHLEGFIAGLGEAIDRLQDLEATGDPGALESAAEALADKATEMGYPALAEAAQRVAVACQEQSPDGMRKRLVELTGLSQRVRRGHRSAA